MTWVGRRRLAVQNLIASTRDVRAVSMSAATATVATGILLAATGGVWIPARRAAANDSVTVRRQ